MPGAKWWLDAPIAFFGVPAAITSGLQAYGAIKRAYRQARRDGEPLYVYAHSGGNAASGYATFYVNVQFGYGSIAHRYTYSGADALWLGTGLSTFSGTRTTSYYNTGDIVSWYGAAWDVTNPMTAVLDPSHNFDALNPNHWCATTSHAPDVGCRTVGDVLDDNVPGYSMGSRVWGALSPVGQAYGIASGIRPGRDYFENAVRLGDPLNGGGATIPVKRQFEDDPAGAFLNHAVPGGPVINLGRKIISRVF
jgi:hypothetical protein